MTNSNVIQIKDRASKKALEALNRVTGLTWDSMPASLVSEELIIGETQQKTYALEKIRA